MKLGFVIPIVGPAVSGAPGLSAFCRGLEDLGYDTLWVGDRLVTPVDVDSSYLAHGPQMTRSLDPVLLWTVAAAATSRMRLNASTLSTFYYEPPHLARLLTTRRAQRRPPWRWCGAGVDEAGVRHRPQRGLAPARQDAR
jgi:alkanesulfonate monooxygenase SsuD/methylene tetrahydromethanopterin reductase-like flavin-dependent oxidoreductase (luciferase family)